MHGNEPLEWPRGRLLRVVVRLSFPPRGTNPPTLGTLASREIPRKSSPVESAFLFGVCLARGLRSRKERSSSPARRPA